MKQIFKLKKLSQRGVLHHLVPIIVILLLGGVTGAFVYRAKAAQPWNGALSVGPSKSGYCMNAPALQQGQQVKLAKCANVVNQKWQLEPAGTVNVKVNGTAKTLRAYTIHTFKNGVFMCVDDYKQSTQQGKNNHLVLWPCNGVDPGQRFFWNGDGHQLQSAVGLSSGLALCIDNEGSKYVADNPIDVFKCWSPAHANQDWFEIGNTATATSAPVTPPTPPPVSPGSGGFGSDRNFTGALQLGLDRSLCLTETATMNAKGHQEVVINTCNKAVTQKWQKVFLDSKNMTFQWKAASGNCLNDPALGVTASATQRVYAQTYPCSNTDHASTWTWANAGNASTYNVNNHEIMNVYSKGCLNDPANSKAIATQQIIYSCTSNSSNEQWFEAAQ
ncbi:MAG TPA: hypothetical protein VLG47_06745 [Candidatus Saccharimonadales bacterium]|nr:hypothetical protein [Candidatus Saccharimonadales bacterium]